MKGLLFVPYRPSKDRKEPMMMGRVQRDKHLKSCGVPAYVSANDKHSEKKKNEREREREMETDRTYMYTYNSVSYTHLDVYKRQI